MKVIILLLLTASICVAEPVIIDGTSKPQIIYSERILVPKARVDAVMSTGTAVAKFSGTNFQAQSAHVTLIHSGSNAGCAWVRIGYTKK